MPDITPKMLPTDENDVTMHIEYEDTDFQVVMRRIANQISLIQVPGILKKARVLKIHLL